MPSVGLQSDLERLPPEGTRRWGDREKGKRGGLGPREGFWVESFWGSTEQGRQAAWRKQTARGDHREASLQRLLRVRTGGWGSPPRHWSWIRANFALSTSGDNCQCLQTFWVVTLGQNGLLLACNRQRPGTLGHPLQRTGQASRQGSCSPAQQCPGRAGASRARPGPRAPLFQKPPGWF